MMDRDNVPQVGIALNEGNMAYDGYLDACVNRADVLEILLNPDCTLPTQLTGPVERDGKPLRLHLSPHIKELRQLEQGSRELGSTIRHLGEERIDAIVTHPFSVNASLDEFSDYLEQLSGQGQVIEVENGAPAARKGADPYHQYEDFCDIGELCRFLSQQPDPHQYRVVFDLGKWAEHYLVTHPGAQELPLGETLEHYQPMIRSLHLCEKQPSIPTDEQKQSVTLHTIPLEREGCLNTVEMLPRFASTGIFTYIIETNEKPAGLYRGLQQVKQGLTLAEARAPGKNTGDVSCYRQ